MTIAVATGKTSPYGKQATGLVEALGGWRFLRKSSKAY